MGYDHGNGHARGNAFRLVTPYGILHGISFGAWEKLVKMFKTADGKQHPSGEIDSAETTMVRYLTDQGETAIWQQWFGLVQNAMPGAKVPCTLETLGENDMVKDRVGFEEMCPTKMGGSDRNQESPSAVTQTITLYYFNPTPLTV